MNKYYFLFLFVLINIFSQVNCLENFLSPYCTTLTKYEKSNFKEILDQWSLEKPVKLALTYELIGDVYYSNKDYISANTFYSNGISLIKDSSNYFLSIGLRKNY